jgi:transaldolase
VTLLFDQAHYLAAANAYMRGIERRVAAGLDPRVGSVASVFVSRWDTAHESVDQADELHNRLGIAMATRTYAAYRELLDSARWGRLANEGALPQRLLWASTGTKDAHASDVLYVRALAAPLTVNTMPEKTLVAFGDHGDVDHLLSRYSPESDRLIGRFGEQGVDLDALAQRLQVEAADAFERSWDELLTTIEAKSAALTPAD